MRAVTALNGGAFALALALSTSVAWLPWLSSAHESPAVLQDGSAQAPLTPLVDHTATSVPRGDYKRIVSANAVADALLLELCAPDRVVAFSAESARNAAKAYRYAGKPTVERLQDIEATLALHPDLVLMSLSGDPGPMLRLRAAGVAVYDLGETRGLATLLPNIHEVAELVGHPERGERFARAIVQQLNAVAADVPTSARRSALYLSSYGGQLFGGSKGTSYHDVLSSAGLIDAAAGYRDWQQYTTEQVLEMNPDMIVTNTGMRKRLCEHGGFSRLASCNGPGAVVEIDDDLLSDPGPAMVD
ncbi:MAG TPA: ABC transporter substrate-binding protein, partial [Polyangiaceae bacterium]|nr:ABC transporter substrate-binding protein [Polyangiaceae bacterium]